MINKLKRLLGIGTISEYVITYTNPLTSSQKTTIANTMINKFSPNCRPNSIMVSTQTTTVRLDSPCLTGEQLKKISDSTLGNNPSEVNYIKLDGNKIWDKNN